MKNVDKWKPKRFVRDKKGRIIGTHNHKIIGNAYEPLIRKYAKGRLADLGCGDVPYYHFYKDDISENICIDWPGIRLEASYLDYEADLNNKLDFLESDSFDTVLCTDVLEHIHSPETLFSEMVRILKKDGNLILAVPFLYWIHEAPHDYHRYTHYKLKEFCNRHNLEIVTLDTYGGLPEIIFDLVHKGYKYYNFPLQKIFYFFWGSLGNFLSKRAMIKRLSDRSKSTFPMGYILIARKK